MDNYIYFRVLDYMYQHEISLKSDLVYVSGLRSVSGVISHLYMANLIKISPKSSKVKTYYELTDKGRDLYHRMDLFYQRYNSVFSMLSKRKLIMKRLYKSVV